MSPVPVSAAFLAAAILMNVQTQAGLPVDINAILVQLPLVGLVIWIITARDKMWQEFLKAERIFWAEQNAVSKVANEKIAEQFTALAQSFTKHDERVNTTMQTMIRFMNFKIEEETQAQRGRDDVKT